jgi:hypothetical protein
MGSVATFTCTALVGTTKKGILKPDADGYYEVTLGAFNFYNSSGQFYPFAAAKGMFEDNSILMRRIKGGNLRGEAGHPKFAPGMSKRDYIARIMDIDEKNVAFHIREIRIDDSAVKDKHGNSVIAVVAWIKPSGSSNGLALKASLDNPHENTCFSIRSITDDSIVDGRYLKEVRYIVTWDWVNEPGISVANKYQFPGLESIQDVRFDVSHLNAIKTHQREFATAAMESQRVEVDNIIHAMGWDKAPVSARRPSSGW